ncbi:Modification methylase HpaII [Candidatus Clavichlamydia salmonicola]|uniref:DNA cytosine methyltransferase n=1 Tax=Candidatus Clavichlamydia salmonicola TaxID=469812 RepID=UPI0018916128|nr:DNA cytosine methyltransferase [Candidatus Clavichlamydia salmonicola]MBF5050974.1 Modification methylase HpaII [Candidatus Clavichlamydia salmonicola]
MNAPFTFIDLFAGIGGFHIAMHSFRGKCVCAVEINKQARVTYEVNFSPLCPDLFSKGLFLNDVTDEAEIVKIPKNVDILCAGFPCQPFSSIGLKKGFEEERGLMFFHIINIIKKASPKALLLENVSHLLSHDNGRTFGYMKEILDKHNYDCHFQVLKACHYGLPTFRPRLYIPCFKKSLKLKKPFSFPEPVPLLFTMSQLLRGKCPRKIGYTVRVGGRGSGINDSRNWDAYDLNGKEHRLTLSQARRLMGFPKTFKFPVSECQAFKQLGNSVAINTVKLVAKAMLESMGIIKDS